MREGNGGRVLPPSPHPLLVEVDDDDDDPPVVVVLVDIDVDTRDIVSSFPSRPMLRKFQQSSSLSSPPATMAATMASLHPPHRLLASSGIAIPPILVRRGLLLLWLSFIVQQDRQRRAGCVGLWKTWRRRLHQDAALRFS